MSEITVEQMIEILKKMDPKAIMVKSTDNFEQNGAIVPVGSAQEVTLKRVKKTYRDAFDGETYTSNVFEYDSSNESIKCVKFF